MIDRDTLWDLDESLGTDFEDSGASGDETPNGNNLIATIRQLQGELKIMDEHGLSYADLSADKQTEVDELVEDLRYHIRKISNLGPEMVGTDDQFELPNGNTIDLPGSATSGGNGSADLPKDPRNN